jgi:hypothetical protein
METTIERLIKKYQRYIGHFHWSLMFDTLTEEQRLSHTLRIMDMEEMITDLKGLMAGKRNSVKATQDTEKAKKETYYKTGVDNIQDADTKNEGIRN